MKNKLTIPEFATRYPEQFHSWIEHLCPDRSLSFDPEEMVTLRDNNGYEGWWVDEYTQNGHPVALSTTFADYGGGPMPDVLLLPWAGHGLDFENVWYSTEMNDFTATALSRMIDALNATP